MNKLIYIAEDEKNIRHLISSFLEKEGYHVNAFETGDQLYKAYQEKACDLIILDIMMPGSGGLIICTKLRAISKVPIIMLTARDTEEDFISGISLGSDDYFTKPFSPIKLIMRVKAMLRRVEMDTAGQAKANEAVAFADLEIYPDKIMAYCKGEELTLTNTEFNLLTYLLENQDKAVSRDELLNKIWGYDSMVETRATDATVKRLRKKLAEIGSAVSIDTLWGHGFRVNIRQVTL